MPRKVKKPEPPEEPKCPWCYHNAPGPNGGLCQPCVAEQSHEAEIMVVVCSPCGAVSKAHTTYGSENCPRCGEVVDTRYVLKAMRLQR